MAIGLSREEAPSRADDPSPSARPRRKRRWGVLLTLLILLLLIAAAAWIGVRGLLARGELSAAVPAAKEVRTAVLAGDLDRAEDAAAELRRRTDAAAGLTGDPVWRAAELVPWIGPNLSAVRSSAGAARTVSAEVVQPLVAVAGAADPRALAIRDGRIDLAPLVAAQPAAEKAQAAFHRAERTVAGIRTDAVIAPVASAVVTLRGFFADTAPAIDAVGNSARLLPGMLGADGPRQYLLLAQNPAELRATGGLIGSVALLRADRGAVSLVSQGSTSDIGPWPQAVAPIPEATEGIFGPLVGRYLQDANMTPDFPVAARTVSAMWTSTRGGTVDGVIAIDPVVLSSLLTATGPVPLPTGETLESGNAVPLLLSHVYARYAEPAQQDAFFASAAAAVFSRVASGGIDGSKLVTALARSGASNRLLLWSARPDEQGILAGTSLAGGLPESTASTAGVGVYFDDATGAKMDYYLGTSVAAGSAICRADRTPTTVVRVTLTNRAPADAAGSLPAYVTGAGWHGVPPGSIATRVVVYGPAGGLLAGTLRDGAQATGLVAGTDQSRPVSVATVQLAPGESTTVEVRFLAVKQTGTGVTVTTTPTLPGDGSTPDVGAETRIEPIAVDCGAVVK